mgnify:FL=1|tara:strand:+ start:303 stop:797 length:495 start_codon:yes stop_codon:yes gene_type:complete
MISFKEYTKKINDGEWEAITEKQLQQTDEQLGPVASQVVIELTEFLWKLLKLLGNIIKFLTVYSVKTIWGGSKFLYRRYNKEARADRRFQRQMARTSKQVKKLRLSQEKYKNAVLRLESMKEALASMSKEDQIKHKQELKNYNDKIDELTRQADAALKKLKAVS